MNYKIKTMWEENKQIILIFLAWWVVINAFAFLSLNRLHLDPSQDSVKTWPKLMIDRFYNPREEFDSFLGMHVRRQSWRHLNIAEDGYNNITDNRGTNLVYFPLYPLLIRYIGKIFSIDYRLSGLLISNICIFISALLFYKLVQIDFKKEVAGRAVLYLFMFPTAFFFTMVYTESLFLLLSLLAFYFALRRQWLLVGLVGFLACLTRITAIYLFLPILYEYFHQEKKFKLNSLFLILIPAGIISFFTYHYYRYNDFFVYFKAQKAWDREFLNFNNLLHSFSSDQQVVNFSLEVFFAAVLFSVCFLAYKRIRTSYFLYLILSTFVPILSGSLTSTNRYMLVMFPIFIVFASLAKNAYFDRLYIFISTLLLSFTTALLVNYFWAG